MTVMATGIKGRCLGCGASLREGEYTRVDFSDGGEPSSGLYCKNKCEPIAGSKPALVGNCVICDVALYEGDEYTDIPTVARGSDFWAGLYCKNCHARDKSKGEARVTLSDIPEMIAFHRYHLTRLYIHDELADTLTRDYHAHLLSIATVGNPPERPTESGDDGWISVHDKMPREGAAVLIWDAAKSRAGVGGWIVSNVGGVSWYINLRGNAEFVEVTHWQPLPGKPKGLEE